MNSWITKSGKKIYYKDLKDSHLLNILKMIKRTAEKGEQKITGGYCDDDTFATGDVDYLEGEEILEKYDYYGLLFEADKRKLKVELK